MEKSSFYPNQLFITPKLEHKIRTLCSYFPDKEWSGVLFTKKITRSNDTRYYEACDMYLLDIGSATHTEYEFTPELMSYMADNDYLDLRMDLIHSHNRMESFFSAVDWSTLISETKTKGSYLSLIVNNKGQYDAKAGELIEGEVHSFPLIIENMGIDQELKEQIELINIQEEDDDTEEL